MIWVLALSFAAFLKMGLKIEVKCTNGFACDVCYYMMRMILSTLRAWAARGNEGLRIIAWLSGVCHVE